MTFPEFEPILTLTNQFVIPPPYRAWCHSCERGFETLEDLMKHQSEALELHRRQPKAKTTDTIWGATA